MSVIDRERVLKLHRQGMSASEIAALVECSPRTITRIRKSEGLSEPLTPEGNGPVTPERLEAARLMLEDGASAKEVRRTLHMSQATLRNHFPGMSWSKGEVCEFARMVAEMNRLERRNGGFSISRAA